MIIFYSGGSRGPEEFIGNEKMNDPSVGVMLTYYEMRGKTKRALIRLEKYKRLKQVKRKVKK